MPSRYGKLKLDDSPRMLVFRVIDDALRGDPTIKRVVTGTGSFQSWRGLPSDKSEFAIEQMPAIRLTPYGGPESYWYPGATKGTLIVQYTVFTPGLAIDDCENLVYAISQVLVPRGAMATVVQPWHQKLKDAGAIIGLITIPQPAFDPRLGDAGSDGYFAATGTFQIDVRMSPKTES